MAQGKVARREGTAFEALNPVSALLRRAPAPLPSFGKIRLYPELGRKTREASRKAELVELAGLGHLPHIEDFPRFIEPLQKFPGVHSSRATETK